MLTIMRHLTAILLLPFTVTVIAPLFLLNAFPANGVRLSDNAFIMDLLRVAGGSLIIAGFALFCRCVGLFAKYGKGTLAPWDPAKNLVIAGPYRFVRNPMIIGVALALTGEAFLLSSLAIATWAVIFVLINHIYFILIEEPGLERRFGASYRIYKSNVPRWLPRIKSLLSIR